MATGDDAIAAGMANVNGATTPANTIDTEIMLTRDYIAQGKGGVAAATAGKAVTRDANGRAQFGTPAAAADAATKGYVDGKTDWSQIANKPTAFPSRSDIVGRPGVSGSVEDGLNAAFGLAQAALPQSGGTVTGALLNPFARNNGVSSWLALGVNPSGQFGFQLSSRRFKKDIATWTPDRQAVLAMRLVEFRYKVAYDELEGELDHGLIAEELHDLGLTWLVAYDSDGLPVTVRYDRIGLALLPIVQDHEARLAALEAR